MSISYDSVVITKAIEILKKARLLNKLTFSRMILASVFGDKTESEHTFNVTNKLLLHRKTACAQL